ncbi:MAG TPA: mucin-2 protein [Nocardioides sp.]|uniref:mucin-2 protein n=1 Tax=Nocardioides sp. TaxID=35761 RepID=UPI002F3F3528
MAHPRHKRETNARRFVSRTGSRTAKFAVGAAVAATLPAVGFGLVRANPAASIDVQGPQQQPVKLDPGRYDAAPVSRSFDRTAARNFQDGIAAQRATARAVERAHERKWTTVDLNLWSSSSRAAEQLGLLDAGKHVLVTGRSADGRVEVVVHGRSRWVTEGYLSEDKPDAGSSAAAAAAGLSMAPCPDGSVEYRLTPAAVYVYRSVCHAFPQITSYGGWDAHGEHASGKALDIMTSDVTLGNAIAAFLQQHAAELHVYDILWRQHIWTPVRASEGWRLFADRGSATANHYDHVHVSVY